MPFHMPMFPWPPPYHQANLDEPVWICKELSKACCSPGMGAGQFSKLFHFQSFFFFSHIQFCSKVTTSALHYEQVANLLCLIKWHDWLSNIMGFHQKTDIILKGSTSSNNSVCIMLYSDIYGLLFYWSEKTKRGDEVATGSTRKATLLWLDLYSVKTADDRWTTNHLFYWAV